MLNFRLGLLGAHDYGSRLPLEWMLIGCIFAKFSLRENLFFMAVVRA